jgi:hypothetical protein
MRAGDPGLQLCQFHRPHGGTASSSFTAHIFLHALIIVPSCQGALCMLCSGFWQQDTGYADASDMQERRM